MRTLQLLSCVFLVLKLANAMEVVYMDQWCGGTKYISSNAAIRVKLTSRSSYKSNMDCTFTVKGTYIDEDQLMINFQDLTVQPDCSSDYLQLYDGSSKFASTIGRNKYCSFLTPSTIYTTSGNALTFYFKSDSYSQYSGFDIILTHYQTGICDSWEISCDNGRCIDDSLRCNGYNPCGDYSDCYGTTIAGGGIAGIVIGGIVFVTIIIVVVFAVRRRRGIYLRRGVASVTVATVQTPPPAAPVGYNQPVPQQFSVPTAPGTYAPAQNMTQYPPVQSAYPPVQTAYPSAQPPPYR